MKFFICLSSVFFNFSFGFIPYPFLSDSYLEPFLSILNNDIIANAECAPQLAISDESVLSRGEDCNRECRKNDSRICHFDFTMKYFQVMGG